MAERAALEEIFSYTKGPFWYRNWNWCSELSVGKWDGVRVDFGGHVIVLDLSSNYLQGSLESVQFLFRLVNLDKLVLSGNQLCGGIPPMIGRLNILTTLDLSWNKLNGKPGFYLLIQSIDHLLRLFPGTIPLEIFELKTLEVLRLDNNQLSGEIPLALGQLTNLINLNLSRNVFSGVVPDVGFRLVNLKMIDFSDNNFDGFVPTLASEYINAHYKFLS